MYVCICFAKTETDIKDAIKSGYNTIDSLTEYLNVTAACGTCQDQVASILDSVICSVCGMKPNSCG